MDARTNLKGKLPSRHATGRCGAMGLEVAAATSSGSRRSINAALHVPLARRDCGINRRAPRNTFKKTSGIADLKPRGRYVAKDVREIGILPFLETLLGYDADVRTSNVKLTDAVLAERKTKSMPGATNLTSGALGKFAQQVGPAVDGVVTHPGGAHEKQCYADI